MKQETKLFESAVPI